MSHSTDSYIKDSSMLPPINLIHANELKYLLFNTNDGISNVLYRTGEWEPHLLEISRFFVNGVDAPLILDVGANIGAYSIPLAKSIQLNGGSVIAFEPQRVIYYQLCGNVVLNRLDNYEAVNAAVGEVIGTIELPTINYEKNHNNGAFSLIKELSELHNMEQYNNYGKSMSTPILTLDSLSILKAPSLIKIDVEGYELNVLKGGANFLKKHCYPPILFEAWDDDWYEKERNELLIFIITMGYEISLKLGMDYIVQHPANPVRVDFQQAQNGVTNMIKIR